MVRSIIVIALAIVCGAAAAIGVNQALRQQTPEAPVVETTTQPVFVAARRIGRGEVVTREMISEVAWPADLLPDEVIGSEGDAVGRVEGPAG